jgi:hypothetical protein
MRVSEGCSRAPADEAGEREWRTNAAQTDAHLTVLLLTGHRIKICLVVQINGITVNPDIIIIEFTAFDELETMSSVKNDLKHFPLEHRP